MIIIIIMNNNISIIILINSKLLKFNDAGENIYNAIFFVFIIKQCIKYETVQNCIIIYL
jgi:hypothetical protein